MSKYHSLVPKLPWQCQCWTQHLLTNEVVLHQTDDNNPQELKHLMSGTWSSALLDFGASKTVCGKEWQNQYISHLPEYQQQNIKYTPSNHVYRFGDRKKIMTIESVTFSAKIEGEHIKIQSDILGNDIPLLFSWSSMKKAEMKINFQNDTITAFRENIPLITTTSSHYAIPLTSAKQAINNIDWENPSAITVTINNINAQSNQTIALNLHWQFAMTFCLLNNAGTPWCDNTVLKNEIKNVTKNCSNMPSILQSTTQTSSRITNSQQHPRNSHNGLKVLSQKNTTPHYWPLYMIVSIHCCSKQKSRYNN